MIGFHFDMGEDSAPDSVASAYMLVMEHLMLFTPIRLCWGHRDSRLLSETLFIKDGPLTLPEPVLETWFRRSDRSCNSRRIMPVPSTSLGRRRREGSLTTSRRSCGSRLRTSAAARAVFRCAVARVRPSRGVPGTGPLEPLRTEDELGREALREARPRNLHGAERADRRLQRDPTFPAESNLIGLERILATIPSLVSHKFEGALFPIELANGIASMSSYPSAKILERFLESC